MTKIDNIGNKLLTDPEVLDVAAFTANYSKVPKNPSNTEGPVGPNASQLQAWIAEPNNAALNDSVIGGGISFVRRVLGGDGKGGEDATDLGVEDKELASWLSEHESVPYKLQKCGSKNASC
ncbi:hypothetical protein F4776DRAFT_662687 [Hypoxylon sp. NC0597]|nr:hypothetical protein F4776DRAFT_662687 [Hypoxylon sp. NC0597]